MKFPTCVRGQRKCVQRIFDRQNNILALIKLVCHRRCQGFSSEIEMPDRLSGNRVQRKHVVRIVGGKQKATSSRQYSRDAFAIPEFTTPNYFAGTIIQRAKGGI